MWKKRLRKTLLYLAGIVAVLLAAGFIYQHFAGRHDGKGYTPVGKLYEVDGGKMHLYSGGQGSTTVVFASGWGTANPYVDFYPLYDKLGSKVKFAVYDRFGYGYSDITDKKRDVDTVADEIHQLLVKSGQHPPYIFAAHSLGSLEAIRYAQKYPGEVKGIVLIEGGSPEYYASQKPLTFIPIIYRILLKTGVIRTLYQFDGFAEQLADQRNGLKMLPRELRDLDRVSTLLLAGNANMTDEIRQSRKNAERILQDRKPLDIPITVLTADNMGKLGMDRAWADSQAALPAWSTAGRQLIVPGSSHYLHHYRPDLVAQEILRLVGE